MSSLDRQTRKRNQPRRAISAPALLFWILLASCCLAVRVVFLYSPDFAALKTSDRELLVDHPSANNAATVAASQDMAMKQSNKPAHPKKSAVNDEKIALAATKQDRTPTQHSAKQAITTSSPYAYAYLIGGCNPDKPEYRPFLSDVLVAAHLLQEELGSKADVVAFVQMSNQCSHTVLPDEDLRWLAATNVKVRYIPKQAAKENFYQLQLNKFRILSLTEYRRVLYMDADTIPINNLDYMFELSDGADGSLLQPNVILAGRLEPASGSFFMLEPNQSYLNELTRIVQSRVDHSTKLEQEGTRDKKDVEFDPLMGWGHSILPPDYWESNRAKSTNWTFCAPHSDQGLLYYYAKYVRQNTSMILANRVQKWQEASDGEPIMVNEKEFPQLPMHKRSNNYTFYQNDASCLKWTAGKGCPQPYSDYIHFAGASKPWAVGIPPNLEQDTNSSPLRLWWSTLTLLNEKLDMGMDEQLRNWTTGSYSPLGKIPNVHDSKSTIVDFG